jgi:hypothetical protein
LENLAAVVKFPHPPQTPAAAPEPQASNRRTTLP